MLKIERARDGYMAEVGPPHADADWRTEEPFGVRQLIEKLRDLNCHQTDIADALAEADPEWRAR